MTQLEGAQRRLQGLVFTCLTSIILLSKDALSRSDTRRKVTATLAAVNVTKRSKAKSDENKNLQLSDKGLTAGLRTLKLLLLSVGRRVSAEELERQVFILLTVLWCQRFKTLKLDESLRAVSPALVEKASNDHDTVDLSRREFLLVLDEAHRCFHRCVVLPFKLGRLSQLCLLTSSRAIVGKAGRNE